MQAAIQRELGSLLTLENLDVVIEDSTLRVEVHYIVLRSGAQETAQVEWRTR
jgi:hypothetical protein